MAKRKKRVRNPFKGRKIRVRKFAKKVGKTAKKGAKFLTEKAKQGGVLVLLTPFKKAMIKQLKMRGVKVPKSLEDVARSFFKNVVQRNAYEEAAYFEGEENLVTTGETDYEHNTIDPITVSAIVSGIVSFFKKLKAKKDEGAELTPSQKVLVAQVEEAEKQVEQITEDETDRTIGSMVQKYWWVGVILVLGIAFASTRK
jgi:hypothetical protein